MSEARFTDADAMDGVIVRNPPRYEDGRGWLAEFFREDEIDSTIRPAMGYLSQTLPGFSRGPHEHRDQTDYFYFAGPGDFLLALWDDRRKSPTQGKRMIVSVGENNPCTVVVPPGVVHAYACISKIPGIAINVPNRLYRGRNKAEDVDEIRHEDDPGSPFVVDFQNVVKEFAR